MSYSNPVIQDFFQNHYGELQAGHFVAYVRSKGGAWLLLNDCTVRVRIGLFLALKTKNFLIELNQAFA